MNNLYARAVFFVRNAERALRFYVEQLGFSEDWSYHEEGRVLVCQVSLFGFELILNEVNDQTQTRSGHGRVFIGLDDDQNEPVHTHIAANGIPTERRDWGRPTLVIRDLDANELFFWDRPAEGTPALELTHTTQPVPGDTEGRVAQGR
jgi:catechol 2,3-dioxygenase-like lactoylglutathione lyase family enzyme